MNNNRFNKIYNLLFKGWFRTTGRSSRLEYICRFTLMWSMCFMSLRIGEFLNQILQNTNNIFLGLVSLFLILIVVFFFILSIIQMFFVSHRRLHDLNSSGWWQLATFLPLGQIFIIGFIFFKGTPTTNKYGEPPVD